MQSVSPRGRLRFEPALGLRDAAWDGVKSSMAGGKAWSGLLVLLLTFTVARSTATFHWVDGIDVVTPIALLAAVVMGALALSPVGEVIALGLGALAGLPVAVIGAWPQIRLHHPNVGFGPHLLTMWSSAINDGTLGSDTSFFLVLICLLLWITGGWLSWCVLRWRKPMLGLIPGAAAFATNLLNIVPGVSDQNGFTLAMLVLTIALLLWTNYTGAIANATLAHVKMTGDARWDFWESGLVAMTGVIVISIFLPPLSTVDRTVAVESGMFTSWAQLQQELSHPGFIGLTGTAGGTTGFSDDVRLNGSLVRTRDIVFTYTVAGGYGGPRYFRGIDDTVTLDGEWKFQPSNGKVSITKNQQIAYGESYDALGVARFNVRMVHPPNGFTTVIFYPGQLLSADRALTVIQSALPSFNFSGQLMTAGRVDSVQPATSAGGYNVYAEYSGATVEQLQGAGTNYPDWLQSYAYVPPYGYRPPDVLNRIREKALEITAGTTNPYDAATAIEAYLRDGRNFTYTLTPPATPPGRDPIDYFLFDSHQGYCEYFATAMGDMLRSIGIPTRLVNGFGPGQFDTTINSYVVRSDDAHTWPEVYFPTYGWIPFEPTADNANVYQTIQRGQSGSNVCLREQGCDTPTSDGLPVVGATLPTPHSHERNDPAGGPNTATIGPRSLLNATFVTRALGVLLAIILLLAAAALRYLRPRSVMAVWKRTVTLAGLAGAERRPGETPLELGRRLRGTFPEAAAPVDALTSAFAVAAYAPDEVASGARPSVMEAWTELRPLLLRRVLSRLRPIRP